MGPRVAHPGRVDVPVSGRRGGSLLLAALLAAAAWALLVASPAMAQEGWNALEDGEIVICTAGQDCEVISDIALPGIPPAGQLASLGCGLALESGTRPEVPVGDDPGLVMCTPGARRDRASMDVVSLHLGGTGVRYGEWVWHGRGGPVPGGRYAQVGDLRIQLVNERPGR